MTKRPLPFGGGRFRHQTAIGFLLLLAIHRESLGQFLDFSLHALDGRCIMRIVENVSDQVTDFDGFGFLETTRGHCWRTETDAGGDEWLLRIVRDGVLVASHV